MTVPGGGTTAIAPPYNVDTMPDLEWHVMLGTTGPDQRLVGRVESVDRDGITLMRLSDRGEEIYVRWDDVVYLMQSGPDRDAELFAALDEWRPA